LEKLSFHPKVVEVSQDLRLPWASGCAKHRSLAHQELTLQLPIMTNPVFDPDVARKLTILQRQILEAQGSLTTHLKLHDTCLQPAIRDRILKKETDQAFKMISNATLNNAIVMTHQIFDGTKPSYSLRHAKGDKKLVKTAEDCKHLRAIFKDHDSTISKVGKYRNTVAAHASPDEYAKDVVGLINLNVWDVIDLLIAASKCVEGLFLTNSVLGMRIPNFSETENVLKSQLEAVFSKGFA
jgi:hypothetical protein